MHYQVKIYEKKRDREHYMRDFGLTAPSRKQAKLFLKQLYGRNIVIEFISEEPEEVKA